jgi:hypothetical protein
MKNLPNKCYEIYQKHGREGVFEFIRKEHPEIKWEYCLPCEFDSPFDDDGDCLVCGSTRPQNVASAIQVIRAIMNNPNLKDKAGAIIARVLLSAEFNPEEEEE